MKKIIPIVLLCYLCIIKSQSLFKWNNITVTLSQRTILSLGPGEIQSGRVLGILGPSGSGKTTFLNVLADRVPNNKQINLISDIKSDLASSDIAFVYQQDSFFPLFTVKESLKLSALLTLKYSNKYLPKLNINTLINDLLNSLSISHIGNSFIGSMDDDSNRGISGGERKRLAIAKEMIKSPPLLILDEPTSGLDAYQALYVMEVLRNLTQYKNLAVVCTIHQPRSSIWNLLDDVIILSPLGKPVYFGSKENVTGYFSSIGYPIPSNTNPAEYLIDLVSFDNTNQYTRNITVQRTQLLVNKFIEFSTKNNLDKLIDTSIDKLVDKKIDDKTEKLIDKKVDKSSVKPSNTLTDKSVDKPVDESIEKSIGQSITIQSNKSVNTKNKFSLFRLISNNVKKIKNSIGRISLLLQRSFLQIIRDVSSNLGQIGVNSILSLVIYAVYGRQSSAITIESVSGRIMIIANSVIMVCMTSLIKTLQLFKKERTVIVREKSQGQYSSFEYLLSKVLSELPWNSLITSLFGVTIHRLTNLNSYLPTFLTTLSLLNFATSTLGLAIGSIFQRGDEALSIGPGVMIVFLIIGAIGPTGASAKLPWYLEPLRNLSPIKWGCESLIAAELGGKPFYHPKPIIKGPFGSIRIVLSTIFEFIKLIPLIIKSKTVGVSNLIEGDETLKSLNVPLDSAKTSISSLAVMTLVHICIAFFGLVSHKS